jgi:hypothetical protein
MRTHGSEGATEPGRDGPSSGVGSPPLSLHPKDLEPYVPGGAAIRKGESHSHREAIHKLERERRERSPEEDRPTRRKHRQVEKKEYTVGSSP